jgi:hypothetical protein
MEEFDADDVMMGPYRVWGTLVLGSSAGILYRRPEDDAVRCRRERHRK